MLPIWFPFKTQTETALLKITNDLLLSSDSGPLNILILLTSHITGTALTWIHSYLTDRHQFIGVNNCTFTPVPLLQGCYNCTMSLSPHIWNLGIIFDSHLKFDHHINHISPGPPSFTLKTLPVSAPHSPSLPPKP